MSSLTKNILNYSIFAIGWYVAVSKTNLFAAGIVLILILLNYLLTNPISIKSFLSILLIGLVGYSNDLILVHLNVFELSSTATNGLWLLTLWVLFATTFNASLKFYGKFHWAFQAVIGGVGGAMTYIGASKIGAIEYLYPLEIILVIHLFNWSILMPCIFRLNLHILGENHDK